MCIGEIFGELTVIEVLPDKKYVMVQCSCGNLKRVQKGHIVAGSTVSCGCYRRNNSSARMTEQNVRHGMCNTSTYKTWEMMIQRCTNTNFTGYAQYGGRGVQVCKSWQDDFMNFLNDMGVRPNGTTLDRIDPNGNYCKENCRWVGKSIQSVNKGMNRANTSGYKGVYWHKSANKWMASIGVMGKSIYLGLFDLIEDAISARKAAEILYYPEVFNRNVDKPKPVL